LDFSVLAAKIFWTVNKSSVLKILKYDKEPFLHQLIFVLCYESALSNYQRSITPLFLGWAHAGHVVQVGSAGKRGKQP
jgi:hypothetical protein